MKINENIMINGQPFSKHLPIPARALPSPQSLCRLRSPASFVLAHSRKVSDNARKWSASGECILHATFIILNIYRRNIFYY